MRSDFMDFQWLIRACTERSFRNSLFGNNKKESKKAIESLKLSPNDEQSLSAVLKDRKLRKLLYVTSVVMSFHWLVRACNEESFRKTLFANPDKARGMLYPAMSKTEWASIRRVLKSNPNLECTITLVRDMILPLTCKRWPCDVAI